MPTITITDEAYLALVSVAQGPLHRTAKRTGPDTWQVPISPDTLARLDAYVKLGVGNTYSDVIIHALAVYLKKIH